jgi:3-oxoacyl-[acyl-carrier protein] reductase
MGSMAKRFQNKVALITGGAGGIGSEIAKAFSREGADVAVFDTNQSAIDAVGKEITAAGGRFFGRVVDVRDQDGVIAAADEIVKTFGGIDLLVAAAGGSLGTPRDIDDISSEDLDLVIDVNIKGTFHCAKAVIPSMKARGGGSIVTFSSIGGRSPSPVTGIPYAAAKAGILGLTRRLAKEVGGENIRVNAIAPGLFLTGRLQGMFDAMSAKEQREVLDAIPLNRMPDISECVEPVLFLSGEGASFITGTVLDVNGGRMMAN